MYDEENIEVKFRPFTKEEKLRCMDNMLNYIRKHTNSSKSYCATDDIYHLCKIVAQTNWMEMVNKRIVVGNDGNDY